MLHSELVRAEIVKARKHRRLDSKLKEVNDHEDEAVAWDGTVTGIVDVVEARPELDDKREWSETPIH